MFRSKPFLQNISLMFNVNRLTTTKNLNLKLNQNNYEKFKKVKRRKENKNYNYDQNLDNLTRTLPITNRSKELNRLLNALNVREAQLSAERFVNDKFLNDLKLLELNRKRTKSTSSSINLLNDLNLSNESIKSLSKQINQQEKIANQSEPEEKIPEKNQRDVQITQNEQALTTTTTLSPTDLIHKAKLQMQKLNDSFDMLIKHQRLAESSNQVEKVNNRQVQFNQDIKAYVDVCCNSSKMLNEAFDLLEKLSLNGKEMSETGEKVRSNMNSHQIINDIEIYNRLMFECAKSGHTSRINLLFKKICTNSNAKKLRPNLNSYAAALQSLGYEVEHLQADQSLAKIRLKVERILWDIKKANFSLETLSTSLNYSSEQQKHIKLAINLIIPEFDFKDCDDLSRENVLIKNLKVKTNLDKQILANIADTVYPSELIDKTSIMSNFDKQIAQEQNQVIQVPSVIPCNEKPFIKKRNEFIKNTLMKTFRENITRNYMKKVRLLKDSKDPDESFIYPFLTVMDQSVYIDILLKHIVKISQNSQFFSPSINSIATDLGSTIEKKYQEFCMNKNKDIEKIRKLYEKFVDYKLQRLENPGENSNNQREEWMQIMRQMSLFRYADETPWSNRIKKKLGKYLLEKVLFKSCIIDKELIKNPYSNDLTGGTKIEEQSDVETSSKMSNKNKKQTKNVDHAFNKIYRLTGIYKEPQVKIHPILTKLFKSELIFETDKMPTLIPPMPWYTPNHGGYFLSKSELLRLGEEVNEQRILLENTHQSNMYPIFDSLNTLSSCPWRINTRILDLLIHVFVNNGNKELEVAEPAWKGPQIPTKPKETMSKEEYKNFVKLKENAKKVRGEMHSLWATELYRLSIANMYRDKVIWFPHSLDFRGRCYPIPPHFNHLGSDIARSIICLAEGKKLGPHGLDMLKIHLINLTGSMKKASLKERLEYANSIIDKIIDSAENPFTGELWWQKSEEKWQTLACCIEISDAIKSKNPSEFVSHFPIHQDGSCNGLQHYAALGRDQDGAVSVNLFPSPKPQDVYSTVLDLVEEQRQQDEKTNEIAKLLAGHIKRKVIKQTVMTTVYNVTFYGAKLQILRQLEDLKDFPLDKAKESSEYIAKQTFSSIRKLFTSAREIQDWFSECAYLITRIRNCSLKWETPLGLPVSQPYFRKPNNNNNNNKKLTDSIISKPDYVKQRNAFPPNFIHSLDSCHMMLTSLYCEKAGITFVSVHDCFWTHASSVEIMNKICREQFVALHSLPLLENLSKFFMDNYKFTETEINSTDNENIQNLMKAFNEKLSKMPRKGEFDLKKVLESVYFFS